MGDMGDTAGGSLGDSEVSVVIDPPMAACEDNCRAEVAAGQSCDASYVSTSAGLSSTTKWSIPSSDSWQSGFQSSGPLFDDVGTAIREQLRDIGVSQDDAALACHECSSIESAMEWLAA